MEKLSNFTVISMARDHHSYGWGRQHGRHSGPQLTLEQRALYDAEFARLEAKRRNCAPEILIKNTDAYISELDFTSDSQKEEKRELVLRLLKTLI